MAHLFHHNRRCILVDCLVDGHRSTHGEHGLDDFVGLDRHLVGQLSNADRLRDRDFTNDRLRRLLEAVLAITTLASTTTTSATALGTLHFLAAAALTLFAIATIIVVVTTFLLRGCLFRRRSTTIGTALFRRCRRQIIGYRRVVDFKLGHFDIRHFSGFGFGLLFRFFTRGVFGSFGFRSGGFLFSDAGIARFTLCFCFRHIAYQLTRARVLGLRRLRLLIFFALNVGFLLTNLYFDRFTALAGLDAAAGFTGQRNTVFARFAVAAAVAFLQKA